MSQFNMKKVTLIIICFLLASCGPLNKQYNKSTFQNDLKEIKETGVAEGETLLLNYYIQKAQAEGKIIDLNTTYKQLLEKAKTEKMKREIAAFILEDSIVKNSIQEKAKTNKLKNIINVSFVSIAVLKSDSNGQFTILLNIKNTGTKNIKAFRGVMTFSDLFGENIKKFELKYNLTLNVRESKSYYFTTNYNDNDKSDVTLNEMDEESIRFVFEPLHIVFTDSSELK